MSYQSSPPLELRHGANLPHWRREGATYAVNFRLADSLPAAVLEQWRIERAHIVANALSLGREVSEHEHRRLQQLYSERVEAWLDKGHGSCLLREERFARLVRDAVLHFDGDRYVVFAWCVMPNHVHAVVKVRQGVDLSKVLLSWKGFTGKRIQELRNCRGDGAVWQKEPYDHLVRDDDDFRRQVLYVLDNPKKAMLRNWPWVGVGSGAPQLRFVGSNVLSMAEHSPSSPCA